MLNGFEPEIASFQSKESVRSDSREGSEGCGGHGCQAWDCFTQLHTFLFPALCDSVNITSRFLALSTWKAQHAHAPAVGRTPSVSASSALCKNSRERDCQPPCLGAPGRSGYLVQGGECRLVHREPWNSGPTWHPALARAQPRSLEGLTAGCVAFLCRTVRLSFSS